ncbi:hypothetical protein KXD40_002680 [Peronospora effusa]|nr:hypothetical protein KXD40_002680 [Peronospora effusa]
MDDVRKEHKIVLWISEHRTRSQSIEHVISTIVLKKSQLQMRQRTETEISTAPVTARVEPV